jgi:hypothetical protein
MSVVTSDFPQICDAFDHIGGLDPLICRNGGGPLQSKAAPEDGKAPKHDPLDFR